MGYDIGTGYYDTKDSEEFFKLWMANTLKHTKPAEIIVANSAGKCLEEFGGTWINFKHNYGHVQSLALTEKYGGWWLGFMASAMLAYCNHRDFIYKEQDCLAFGPWLAHLYAVSKRTKAPVIIGRFTQHAYSVEQSLVLIRRYAILDFISKYLSIPGTEAVRVGRPELKFLSIMKAHPRMVTYMDMGCGRDRPIPYSAKCFYVQHIRPAEMKELKKRGLV
jgi:hypothetical protein